ncbi:AmpG family muropeptide MFS transporter [Sphingomonas sp. LaA6.9]|uniref:AmpG family muropeptide MFS transporter n=1 Tax=Sphingomonas sp. LaA6.9 TaxID=2919914 RepID=UPI001F4F21D9|nr:permease [Sphingomonas sp. LaA6.9]MCJ8156863.1 permease [Sphingomonas sp. LaA6.9]
MSDAGTATAGTFVPSALPSIRARQALYILLGFSAGLPFYMFSTVLMLRLQAHGVGLVIIGFFAWVQLLPTFKFLWAPMLDQFDVPGFARFWGKRRGWIMLSQLGIFTAMIAMALTSSDADLAITALFAVLLAFWTTTLEVAADAWRIEIAPTQHEQGPVAAANLWGYRTAMVAAGSGALLIADQADWTISYLAIAAAAFLPFPILAAMRPDPAHGGNRWAALGAGLIASGLILFAAMLLTAAAGWLLLGAAAQLGVSDKTNVTPYVLVICMVPFLIMAAAIPRIRTLASGHPLRRSAAVGPYVDFFWRYAYGALLVLAFVSVYRMGDVLALNLSKPMIKQLGYSLSEIGRADSYVALIASIVGVGLGGLMAARWRWGVTLSIGAVFAALGNFGFVWLAHQTPSEATLYIATAADQFGNGMAGAIFVVYLSMLVNPRYPGAQYAFLSGFAFLLPRLLSGAGGAMVMQIGYDGFFILSGVVSLAAILFLPLIARIRPRGEGI